MKVERHGHGIEAFIDKRERGAVLPDKGNPVREVRLFYFFTSHIHHAFGYVGPDEHIGLQFAAGKYRAIKQSERTYVLKIKCVMTVRNK